MPSAVRKNGRMVSPETDASSSTKAEKSIAVMLRPQHQQSTIQCPPARQPPDRPGASCEPASPGDAQPSAANLTTIRSAMRDRRAAPSLPNDQRVCLISTETSYASSRLGASVSPCE